MAVDELCNALARALADRTARARGLEPLTDRQWLVGGLGWIDEATCLLPVVEQYAAERLDKFETAVRELHYPEPTSPPCCAEDGFDWPCPTIRALDGAR